MTRPKGFKMSEETKRKISKSNSIALLGHTPWNKGKTGVYSEDTLKLMSLSRMGKNIHTNDWKANHSLKMKGHKTSEETKRKIVETRMKNGSYKHSEDSRRKIGLSGIGRMPWNKCKTKQDGIYSEDTLKKMSISQTKRFIDNPKQKGIKFTEEHRHKLKQARSKQISPMKDTKIEVKIQNFLEQLNIEYIKHKYININHSYQCDIFIPSINLVIECDGNYWHKYPVGLDKDHIRTKELQEQGYNVLRLWEHEIKQMDIKEFKKRWDTFNLL